MDKRVIARPFMLLLIALGAVVCANAVYHLPSARLDFGFLLLAAATVGVTSRITVRVPGVNAHITISETFIFLAMLIYGVEGAILLAAADAVRSTLLISRKPITIACNAAMLAIATYATGLVLRLLVAPTTELPLRPFSAQLAAAVTLMAFVQYLGNSILVATAQALKTNQPIWNLWSKYCQWTSIGYFAGASAALVAAKFAGYIGVYYVVAGVPVVAIIYMTYRTYLKNMEVMAAAAKAEASAEERALAAAAQAEQAQRHIEELNHYIAEQDRIREQFAQVEKLSALGELASGVAHDLNNTLAGILGRAQILLETKDPERIESGLRLIIKTAKDGAKTVKRIQDFARQRRDHDFQPVSMDQVLLDVREITRPRWKNTAEASNVHISLELQLGSDNTLVMGDESELREVLVNMVFNAVDAMPQGGAITLSTRTAGDRLEVSVRDTGLGMSDEVRPRVFDPFFTTKGKAGMGLGLAVSYGIIRRHEGSVEVHSEVGRGTTFRMSLPVAHNAVRRSAPTGELAALAPRGEGEGAARILVVDDEDHMRDLLKDMLEKDGYQVVQASGGHEALSVLNETACDAVFTDLGMPGMSGWELARAIRKQNRQLPLAVITGWGEAVGSHEQQAAGVDWLVPKPFDASQIADIARQVSRRRLCPADAEAKSAAA
jgi:signal transduction histidine kinase/CheY-like chemotaxis protein